MKSTFSMLDQKRGAFTVLMILWNYHRPVTKGELVEEAGRESLGRTALYSAVNALRDAGLIEEKPEIWSGKRVVTVNPTSKGLTVAEELSKIKELMDA